MNIRKTPMIAGRYAPIAPQRPQPVPINSVRVNLTQVTLKSGALPASDAEVIVRPVITLLSYNSDSSDYLVLQGDCLPFDKADLRTATESGCQGFFVRSQDNTRQTIGSILLAIDLPDYPPWFQPMYGASLTIRDAFEQCVCNALVLAEKLAAGDLMKKKTVAFPALGTYGLKLVPTVDAKIMLSFILGFAKKSRLSEIQIMLDNTTLFNIFSRELHYILHPEAARLPLSPQDQRVLIAYCSRYEH